MAMMNSERARRRRRRRQEGWNEYDHHDSSSGEENNYGERKGAIWPVSVMLRNCLPQPCHVKNENEDVVHSKMEQQQRQRPLHPEKGISSQNSAAPNVNYDAAAAAAAADYDTQYTHRSKRSCLNEDYYENTQSNNDDYDLSQSLFSQKQQQRQQQQQQRGYNHNHILPNNINHDIDNIDTDTNLTRNRNHTTITATSSKIQKLKAKLVSIKFDGIDASLENNRMWPSNDNLLGMIVSSSTTTKPRLITTTTVDNKKCDSESFSSSKDIEYLYRTSFLTLEVFDNNAAATTATTTTSTSTGKRTTSKDDNNDYTKVWNVNASSKIMSTLCGSYDTSTLVNNKQGKLSLVSELLRGLICLDVILDWTLVCNDRYDDDDERTNNYDVEKVTLPWFDF
mmetsp:Transcript_7931/g.10089  ORF Transcript_7931/g.10089 Transcript_7931/m.10089 type:complete len:395 (+) Transcript_7931:187-1371(+)